MQEPNASDVQAQIDEIREQILPSIQQKSQ
jgi:hypothetical protein